MGFTIKFVAHADGSPCDHAGEYLKEFVAVAMDAHGKYLPGGVLTATPDVEQAMHFATTADALAFYRTQKGLRPDGKPNRPLTSYTVEVSRIEEAA